jgi:hypothetical protein
MAARRNPGAPCGALAYSDYIEAQFTHRKEIKMNVLKNFEALFVVTAALACAATYALETTPVNAADANMQVVVVSAKRLTPEQKLQSVLEERATTMAADTSAKESKI